MPPSLLPSPLRAGLNCHLLTEGAPSPAFALEIPAQMRWAGKENGSPPERVFWLCVCPSFCILHFDIPKKGVMRARWVGWGEGWTEEDVGGALAKT